MILGKENDLRDDFRSLWIIIHKGQEESSPMLRMDRQYIQHRTTKLVNNVAAQMDSVIGQFAVNERMTSFDFNIFKPQQRQSCTI